MPITELIVPVVVRLISKMLLRAMARITREEGLSAIIVEQHPQAILKISHQAVVLDHGTVVHSQLVSEIAHEPDYDAALAALG